MNIPEKEDIEIYQGSSFFKEWQWLDGDEDVPSSLLPVNLTSFIAYMQIKATFDDPTALCSIDSITANEITFEHEDGIIYIRIPPEKTFVLPWKKKLFYDVKLVNYESKDAYRFKEGSVTVYPEITKIKTPIVC
jgi:hypothetical protein